MTLIEFIRAELDAVHGEQRKTMRRYFKRCVEEERNDRQVTGRVLRKHFSTYSMSATNRVPRIWECETLVKGQYVHYTADRYLDTLVRFHPWWSKWSDADVEEAFLTLK